MPASHSLVLMGIAVANAGAQVPPSATEISHHAGLHAAATSGDGAAIAKLAAGANVDLADR